MLIFGKNIDSKKYFLKVNVDEKTNVNNVLWSFSLRGRRCTERAKQQGINGG